MLNRECPVCDYLPNENDLCPFCSGFGAVDVHQELDALLPQCEKTPAFKHKEAVLVSISVKSDATLSRMFREVAFHIIASDNTGKSPLVVVRGLEGEILPWTTLPTRLFQAKFMPTNTGFISFAYVAAGRKPLVQEDKNMPLKGIKAYRSDMKIAYIGRNTNKFFANDTRMLHFKIDMTGHIFQGTRAMVKEGHLPTYETPPFRWLDVRVLNRLGCSAVGDFHCYAFKADYDGHDTYDLFGEDFFGMPNPMADIISLTSQHIFELPSEHIVAPTTRTSPADAGRRHQSSNSIVDSSWQPPDYWNTDDYFKRSNQARTNMTENAYAQHQRGGHSRHQQHSSNTYTWNGKAHLKTSTEEFEPGTILDEEKIFDWE